MDEALRRSPDALPSDDERLARLVTSGSSRAFSTLYARYHELLYRYCRSILLHEADAHDAVQSTFTRVLEALQRGQRDAPLRPWLFRIAHNESISMLRRRKVAHALSAHLRPLSVAVEDRVGHLEQVGLLLEDLQELAPRQRGALVMRELAGLSHEEIGAALNISVSGARQAIFEARGALAEFAEGRAMACEDVREELSDGDRRVMRRRPIRAHLRDCAACAAFAATRAERRNGLRALAAPAAASPIKFLARMVGAGAVGGTEAAGGGGGFFAGVANSLSGAALVAKPAAVLAIALTAAAGTGSIIYSMSNQRFAARPQSAAQTLQAAPASAQAAVVPDPAGKPAGSRSRTRGRSREPAGALGNAGSGSTAGRASGVTSHGFRPPARRPAGTSHGRSTTAPPSTAGEIRVQTAPSGSGTSDSAGASGGGGGSSGQTGTNGGGAGNGDQPPEQVQASGGGGGNGDGDQPAGQANAGAGRNGNAGQPPGLIGAPGNGNAGQPPGLTGSRGNGNAGQPPGLSGSRGNGNAGQPPGLSGSRGNGNAGGKSHGG
jgi:RNA polymerase sigma factor (sigma-70 family)